MGGGVVAGQVVSDLETHICLLSHRLRQERAPECRRDQGWQPARRSTRASAGPASKPGGSVSAPAHRRIPTALAVESSFRLVPWAGGSPASCRRAYRARVQTGGASLRCRHGTSMRATSGIEPEVPLLCEVEGRREADFPFRRRLTV
jgi:hypothetical protein